MSLHSRLKIIGWIIITILSLAYFIGFIAAIVNYSEISHWLGTSSRLGVIFATVFQIWIWITAFVLLYMGYKRVTGVARKEENSRN